MRYRHKKSSVIIEVKSEMGGCWEPVEENSAPPVDSPAPEDNKAEQETENPSDPETVPEDKPKDTRTKKEK